MTEEIKEILDTFKKLTEDYSSSSLLDFEEYEIPCIQLKILLDYITDLQQDLDKANDIIEKDRQFYKCRMDEYVELKKENEELNNIINELEKELEQEIAVVGANRTVDNNNPEWWYKLNCYNNVLDKLKELKESEK